MITLKTNIKQLIKNFQADEPKIMNAIYNGLFTGMRYFESHIIKRYYSGRKGNRLGLRRITGTLARSWLVQAKTNLIVLGSRTIYGAVHEFGYPPKNIPKRTYVMQDFKTTGRELLNKYVAKKLMRFIKK